MALMLWLDWVIDDDDDDDDDDDYHSRRLHGM
jgi:hypothetical protein